MATYQALIEALRSLARSKHDDHSLADEGADCILMLEDELSALRGELERLRAVEAAAKSWADYSHGHAGHCDARAKLFSLVENAALARPKRPTLSGNELVGYGFAPGNYSCHCYVCDKTFDGDKLAVTCRECALAMKAKRPPEQEAQPQAERCECNDASGDVLTKPPCPIHGRKGSAK